MPRQGRAANQMRPVEIVPHAQRFAEGSAIIRVGNTEVLCSASVETGVPPWMRGKQSGWLTAEYALLPRSTSTRTRRERSGASGRTQEIQRLISRSLRMALDLSLLGERTITVDCDVLQADGGTRTAAITGGWVAVELAVAGLLRSGELESSPVSRQIAAVSVGIVDGVALLDLEYSEDSTADADCNLVQDEYGAIIDVQGSAERRPFDRAQLERLLELGEGGIRELLELQREALRG